MESIIVKVRLNIGSKIVGGGTCCGDCVCGRSDLGGQHCRHGGCACNCYGALNRCCICNK